MPAFRIFERHPPPHRLLLLGQIDDAKTPFADLLQQFVGADEGAGTFGNGRFERC